MKSSRSKASPLSEWTAGAFMTPQPLTIGRGESLATAHRMMRSNRVRHLPVLEHGELVGIVTLRDLYFLETIRGVDLDDDTVEDAMTPDAYAVTPDVPISTVARHMVRSRIGCAVIMERGRVAGIFTATDALRMIGDLAPAPPAPKKTAARRSASTHHAARASAV
jgi:acetoin utilization protein AcuB